MSDPRIGELRAFWCEDAYKRKYGLPYCWSRGKDEKLLTTVIEWATSSFGHEGSVNKIKDGMRAYLNSNDGFVTKDNHPFAMFSSGVHKWFVQSKPAEERTQKVPCMFCHNRGIMHYKEKPYRCSCGWGYDYRKNFVEAPVEAFFPIVCDDLYLSLEIAKDPIRYLKGFIELNKTIKKCAATFHERFGKAIKEVCGKEKVKEVWEEMQKQNKQSVGGLVKV